MQDMASELCKVARDLVSGYKSEFMVLRPLVLEKESGTSTSLANLKKILDSGYRAVEGVYRWNKNQADWRFEVFFKAKEFNKVVSHTFLGFSVGYSGQGSRGMLEAGKMMGYKFDEENVLGGGLPEKGIVKIRDL